MQKEIMKNSSLKNKIIKHLLVISIFLVLTIIVTFPMILDFTTQAAGQGCYDKCHMMWRMWWAGFSNENNLDFYHSQYIFHPNGVSISGNLAHFTTGIGSILLNLFGNVLAWNIIWLSGFVFGGYSAFLLSNHLTKNPYSSIVAGIVFTFSTYHVVHSGFHIGLGMIIWLPLFILILFKILEKNSKVLILLGGIFLFLASITHIWFFVMLIIFSIIFFVIHIFKQKDVTNKKFVMNFSLILGIGIIASLIMFMPVLTSDVEYEQRVLNEHITYSSGLVNLVTPTFYHSSQIHSDYKLMLEIYNSLDEDIGITQSIESFSYLGYSVIFLSILALKFRYKFSWFWVLSGVVFTLLSFGPELKIINNLTGILMPERILFDYVPLWEEFRSPGRFIIMTHLSMGILSAFAVNGIMNSKYFSKKILAIILIGIVVILIFDLSASPYASHTQPISKIYEEIKNDNNDFVVFEAPIGSPQGSKLTSHPSFDYYQAFHEKPIIGGYESRASISTLTQTDKYFINNFQLRSSEKDIVKQNLDEHGLSILNYFNIKYIIIHKNEVTALTNLETAVVPTEKYFLKKSEKIMSEILGNDKPYFEDDNLIAYKISKSENSKPYFILGEGWHRFDSAINARSMYPESNIEIINPKDNEIKYSLSIRLLAVEHNRHVEVFLNGKYLQEYNISTDSVTTMKFNEIILLPGKNTVSIKADGYELLVDPETNREYKISLAGLSVSGN